MPQMMPLNWIILYSMFSILILMMLIINFFFMKYTPIFKQSKYLTNSMNWKW